MHTLIPVLSLVVAALAVFVGPIISWWVAKRQIASSLSVANKQITAPMRQAWINNLRELLAEVIASALHYYVAGFEDRKDEEYQHLTLLEHKIRLMLNANEQDHQQLEAAIRRLIELIHQAADFDNTFPDVHAHVITLSRSVLKREWDRIKGPIAGASNIEA